MTRYNILKIELGNSVVGTKISVSIHRLFRKSIIDTFTCYRSSIMTGGEWVSDSTYKVADVELNILLNDSAQAYARLTRMELK